MQKMLRINLCLVVGVFVWGFASCSITCPDGHVCSDTASCCMTKDGYRCCPYPKAVCCSDMAHCCPSGFSCNLATQMCEKENEPWVSMPMKEKEAVEKPSTPVQPVSTVQELEINHVPDQQKSSVVYCDNYYYCPDYTTCCRHPNRSWFCCAYSPGRCCLDGYHCCPYGFDCDYTYTHCVRQGLRYPFTPKQALTSVPAAHISTLEDKTTVNVPNSVKPMAALTEASGSNSEAGATRCDSEFYCPGGSSCCKRPDGKWSCCPYPLGKCCADGQHCCQYGYTCDPTSLTCRSLAS
ncbi:progranulin-like isoform X2 [Pagrus major]|uniref:progranulin-like isoform X2 n=1 Tax=Pagrus major TaxID=143350 RepID=UPI003CC8C470